MYDLPNIKDNSSVGDKEMQHNAAYGVSVVNN